MSFGISKKQIPSFLGRNCILLQIHEDGGKTLFTAMPFIIVKKVGNDPNVYTKEEWLNKLGYILMEYYSLIAIRNDDTSKLTDLE